LLVLWSFAPPLPAGLDLVVTTTSDAHVDSRLTLREALATIVSTTLEPYTHHTITFSEEVANRTIALGSAPLPVLSGPRTLFITGANVTIDAQGLGNMLTIDANFSLAYVFSFSIFLEFNLIG
jgi:hypothetical protein